MAEVRAEERADAVIVGARCSGAAAAAMLAGAGRRVVVLDRARFPSDTLSTHAMFPSGCAEFQRIGAWPRILDEIDPTPLTHVQVTIDGEIELRERWAPVDGIDHGVSIPRNLLDVVLVANARERGADVREGCPVDGVIWEHGRVVGVDYTDADGAERRVRADIVIGADGRRSAVAAGVGAWRPYRVSRNGRGLVFRYMDDPAHEPWHRHTMWQWRDADSLAFAFPNPNGRVLTLFMGSADEAYEARSDPEAYWERKLAMHPGCAARIEGAGEPDEAALDRRRRRLLAGVERAGLGAGRRREPLQGSRHGTGHGGRAADGAHPRRGAGSRARRPGRNRPPDPALGAGHDELTACTPTTSPTWTRSCVLPRRSSREALQLLGRDSEPAFSDVIGRTRTAQEVFGAPLIVRATARALVKGPDRPRVLREALADFGTEMRVRRELARGEFRPAGPVRGSDHPGAEWRDAPAQRAGAA